MSDAWPVTELRLTKRTRGDRFAASTYLSPRIQRATILSILDMRDARLLFLSDNNRSRYRLSKNANKNSSERDK
jgi:hypothetical protein